MKVEHELKLVKTETSMIRRMSEFMLKERKKDAELRELLGLQPVNLVINEGILEMLNIQMMLTGSSDA